MSARTTARLAGLLLAAGVAISPAAMLPVAAAPLRPGSNGAPARAQTPPDMVASLEDQTILEDGDTTYRFTIRNDGGPCSGDVWVAWSYRARSDNGAEAEESGAQTFGPLGRGGLRVVEVVCRPDDGARCVTAGIEIALGTNSAEFPSLGP